MRHSQWTLQGCVSAQRGIARAQRQVGIQLSRDHPGIHPPLGKRTCISLWDGQEPANTERFQGLVPLLPRLCPLSVPKGGVCGVHSESP